METFKYRIDQLRHLAKIRALKMDDYIDDVHTSDKTEFEENTNLFFNWIEEMESKDKISELLSIRIN